MSWSGSGVWFEVGASVLGRGRDSACLAWRGRGIPLVAPLCYNIDLFARLGLIAVATSVLKDRLLVLWGREWTCHERERHGGTLEIMWGRYRTTSSGHQGP